MSGWSVLLLGVGLGLRHAADADHVVVVSALIQRELGTWRSARIAALWGAGHTVSFLGLGLLIVLGGLQVSSAFEGFAEGLVAAMLIGIGLWHFARAWTVVPPGSHRLDQPGRAARRLRPLLVGIVHGMAGSASIALLAATTIASPALAVAYLALFGLGTVLGMVGLTVVMAGPMGWTIRRGGAVERSVTMIPALLSIALGVVVVVRALSWPSSS
jgi:hypothetical protein